MTRWLVALAGALLVAAAGYLLFLNPEPVMVRLAPHRTATVPLAGALLLAFAAGGVLVAIGSAARAGTQGWRRWRAGRHAEREARRASVTARAQELLWAGDYAQARAELSRAAGRAPEAGHVVLLAETYLHEGDPAAARRVLEEALVEIGHDARLLALLADAAERAGDLRGAADALERARLGRPASPRLTRRLRDLYAASERWPEALALQGELLLRLREPAALAVEERVLRGLRYQAALAEADPGRALRALKAVAREAPGFVPAAVAVGDRLAAAGRTFAARRAWERAARRQPDAILLDRLEHLNAGEGRPERMTRLYRRLQRRHPTLPALSLLLARHLIAQGDLEGAGAALAMLPPPLDVHPLAQALRGELHRRRGNHDLAAETFARAWGADLDVLAPFRCAVCRRTVDAWTGYCRECSRWGTYRAAVESAASPG